MSPRSNPCKKNAVKFGETQNGQSRAKPSLEGKCRDLTAAPLHSYHIAMWKKHCLHCKKEFTTDNQRKLYCSHEHAVRFRYLKDKERHHAIWRRYYQRHKEVLIPKKIAYLKKHADRVREVNNKATLKYKDKTRLDGKKQEVYEKFGNKCAHCGSTKTLNIHHIDNQGWWDGGTPNNNLENLLLLCGSCHQKLHWQTTRVKRKSDTPRNRR